MTFRKKPGTKTSTKLRYSFFLILDSLGRFVTDVSGQRIVPIFKGQDVQEDIFALEDGTDTLSRNVRDKSLYVAQQLKRARS